MQTWEITTSTVIRKLFDVNDVIDTRGQRIQPGKLNCRTFGNEMLPYEANFKTLAHFGGGIL